MYKGDIADFPHEVVEWMLEQQVKQGNKRDVSVFEECYCTTQAGGGFNWHDTNDGYFCRQVTEYRNFDLFFSRYPRKPIKLNARQRVDTNNANIEAVLSRLEFIRFRTKREKKAVVDGLKSQIIKTNEDEN